MNKVVRKLVLILFSFIAACSFMGCGTTSVPSFDPLPEWDTSANLTTYEHAAYKLSFFDMRNPTTDTPTLYAPNGKKIGEGTLTTTLSKYAPTEGEKSDAQYSNCLELTTVYKLTYNTAFVHPMTGKKFDDGVSFYLKSSVVFSVDKHFRFRPRRATYTRVYNYENKDKPTAVAVADREFEANMDYVATYGNSLKVKELVFDTGLTSSTPKLIKALPAGCDGFASFLSDENTTQEMKEETFEYAERPENGNGTDIFDNNLWFILTRFSSNFKESWSQSFNLNDMPTFLRTMINNKYDSKFLVKNITATASAKGEWMLPDYDGNAEGLGDGDNIADKRADESYWQSCTDVTYSYKDGGNPKGPGWSARFALGRNPKNGHALSNFMVAYSQREFNVGGELLFTTVATLKTVSIVPPQKA